VDLWRPIRDRDARSHPNDEGGELAMPEMDLSTFQSLNMAIAGGISTFALLFMIGKLLFTWPLLDARLNELRSYCGLMNPSSLQSNLNNQFFQRKKKNQKKKTNLKRKFWSISLKILLGKKI